MGHPHSSHWAGWVCSLQEPGERRCPNTSWHHHPAPCTRQQLPARAQGHARGGLFLSYLMLPLKKPHIPESPQTTSFEMGLSEMGHFQPRSTIEELAWGDGSPSMDIPEYPTLWDSLGCPISMSYNVCLMLSGATCIPWGELKSSLLTFSWLLSK